LMASGSTILAPGSPFRTPSATPTRCWWFRRKSGGASREARGHRQRGSGARATSLLCPPEQAIGRQPQATGSAGLPGPA
jgi:hypothetical protein